MLCSLSILEVGKRKNSNEQYINVLLLDQLVWAWRIWECFKILKEPRPVLQSQYPVFIDSEWLPEEETETYSCLIMLLFRSSLQESSTYKGLWNGFTSSSNHHANLKTTIFYLITHQWMATMLQHPLPCAGPVFGFHFFTMVQLHTSMEDRYTSAVRDYADPDT